MQNIFSDDATASVDEAAFMNWRISEDSEILNLMNVADGFMQSAIELAKICLVDNSDKKADVLIFPMLTNANHGIELYLKAMNWTLNRLLERVGDLCLV